MTGSDFTFLKHLGFADLPITSNFDFFVPDMLAQTKTVMKGYLKRKPFSISIFSNSERNLVSSLIIWWRVAFDQIMIALSLKGTPNKS